MNLLGLGVAGAAFGAGDDVSHPRPGRLDRASRLFLAAAQHAHVTVDHNAGIYVATDLGAFAPNAEHWGHVLASGVHAVSPLVFPATVPSAAAAEVAIVFAAMGPNNTLCGGAAAATQIVELAQQSAAAMVGVVTGWHPAMERLGLTAEQCDGAICAYLGAGTAVGMKHRSHDNPFFDAFLKAIDRLA